MTRSWSTTRSIRPTVLTRRLAIPLVSQLSPFRAEHELTMPVLQTTLRVPGLFVTFAPFHVFLALAVRCLLRLQKARRSSSIRRSLQMCRGGGGRHSPKKPPPVLWSGGVYQEDIDALVQSCLNDPDINIKAVPDWLEQQIYRSTITLVLNSLHQALHGIHGKRLLQHYEFQLTRLPRRPKNLQKAMTTLGSHYAQQVEYSQKHHEKLENVANRLLANQHINQPLIPDVLERQLYANCLKIVFRVLDLLAVSFRVTLCGHDLKVVLEPSSEEDLLTRESYRDAALDRLATLSDAKPKKSSSTSVLTDSSVQKMIEVARNLGAKSDDPRYFWQRWLSPANNEFIAQLHASVYCLVLGIVDDLLEHTEIQLLSDRIEFDLVPVDDDGNSTTVDVDITAEAVAAGMKKNPMPMVVKAHDLSIASSKATRSKNVALVVAGVAVGYALHAIVEHHGSLDMAKVMTSIQSHLPKWGTSIVESVGSRLESASMFLSSILQKARGVFQKKTEPTKFSTWKRKESKKQWFGKTRQDDSKDDSGENNSNREGKESD